MYKYFNNNINSLEDLKAQFRTLAKANHPDAGGSEEAMKAINKEFDELFPIWKAKLKYATVDTANSFRRQFYTQNGWAGDRYEVGKSLKSIAALVRAYVKERYPDYRFSIRTHYASMCQELTVEMKKSPIPIHKTADELTSDDILKAARSLSDNGIIHTSDGFVFDEVRETLKGIYAKGYAEREGSNYHYSATSFMILNDATKAVLDDVDDYVNSYRYDDSDGMIDYFDTNFYYFNCGSRDVEIVAPKARRARTTSVSTETAGAAEMYEIKEDVHTKTGEKLWVVKVLKTLNREDYISEKKHMSELGGYYSKFKHGFIFKNDPSAELV